MNYVNSFVNRLRSLKAIDGVFLFAVLLRLVLSIINTESNDDHVTPVLLFIKNGALPMTNDCWECFQPPLFYLIVGNIARLLSISTDIHVFSLIQSINFIASIIILRAIRLTIHKISLAPKPKLVIFAFFAFNPELISLSVLATNDTLAILFGTLILLQLSKPDSYKKWISIAVLTILGSITKGNFLVFPIGLSAIVLFKIVVIRPFTLRRLLMLVWVIGVFLVIAFSGGYVEKFQTYRTPFKTNMNKSAPPVISGDDTAYVGRKGVNSITTSYLSFNIISLLKKPYITNGTVCLEAHRQSFFTLLFGQYSNFLFENHPFKWQTNNNDSHNISRINYVVHVVILCFVLWAVFSIVFEKDWSARFVKDATWVQVFLLGAFVVFVVKYSYDYRDYSTIKLAFIYPVYVGLVSLTSTIIGHLRHKYQNMISGLMVVAVVLYLINYVYLIRAILQ
jgi:uncharacterized membrane protein YwzB